MSLFSFLFENRTSIGLIADIIGIGGAFSAGAAWWQLMKTKKEHERLNHIVSVALQCTEDTRQIIPLMVVRRKDITRAELQGILGTIKMAKEHSRYKLSDLNSRKFWEDIEQIRASDSDNELIIPCSTEEIDQFDPSAITYR